MCGYDCNCIIDNKSIVVTNDTLQEHIYKLKYNPNSDSDKEALLINYNYEQLKGEIDSEDELEHFEDSVLFLFQCGYDVYHRTGDCQMELIEL